MRVLADTGAASYRQTAKRGAAIPAAWQVWQPTRELMVVWEAARRCQATFISSKMRIHDLIFRPRLIDHCVTKRSVGRCTASQTASASVASFFWRLTKRFHLVRCNDPCIRSQFSDLMGPVVAAGASLDGDPAKAGFAPREIREPDCCAASCEGLQLLMPLRRAPGTRFSPDRTRSC